MFRQRPNVDKSASRVDYQQAQHGRRKAANDRETAVHARGTVAIDGRGKRRKPGDGKRRKKHKHRSRRKHRKHREKTVLKLPRASQAANAPPPLDPVPERIMTAHLTPSKRKFRRSVRHVHMALALAKISKDKQRGATGGGGGGGGMARAASVGSMRGERCGSRGR